MLIACFSLLMGVTSCSSDNFEDYGPEESVPGIESRGWIRTIKSVDGTLPGTRGVAVTNKLWNPGDTIRIKFLNGGSDIQDTVKKYADIWLQHANLVFNYVGTNDTADVKIGFNMDSRSLVWSTIGTDCRQIPQDTPSLNFVDLQDYLTIDTDFIRGEILRGFGHILGLGFEHRNPTSPVSFNSKARAYFLGKGLSANDVDNHILPYYTTNQTNYTQYDRNSIMVLDISKDIITIRSQATICNYDLSATDIAFIDSLYPYPQMPSVLINDVHWAVCNVDAPGRFAATPESPGMFYQWNRKKAWPGTYGPNNNVTVSGWDTSMPSGNSWAAVNDPSPKGWRLPTVNDFNKLADAAKVTQVWTIQNGVSGVIYTDKASGNFIFLPAVGQRDPFDGYLLFVDLAGIYWSSSSAGSNYAWRLYLEYGINTNDPTWTQTGLFYSNRSCGNSVRCVRDE